MMGGMGMHAGVGKVVAVWNAGTRPPPNGPGWIGLAIAIMIGLAVVLVGAIVWLISRVVSCWARRSRSETSNAARHTTDHPPQFQPCEDALVPAGFGGWGPRVWQVMGRNLGPMLLFAGSASLIYGLLRVLLNVLLPGMVGTPLASSLANLRWPAGYPHPTRHPLRDIAVALHATVFGPEAYARSAILALFSVLSFSFSDVALTYIIVRNAAGMSTSLGQAARFAVGRWPAMAWWNLLGSVLLPLGLILLIVPGVVVLVALGPLSGVVAVERRGLGRSIALVRTRFGPTAGRLLLAGLIYSAGDACATFIVSSLFGKVNPLGEGSVAAVLAMALLPLPFYMGFVAARVVTYAELRAHERPGVQTSTLAAEL